MFQGFQFRWVILCFALTQLSSVASDWPQFLGPTRNAVYSGLALSEDWGKDGPPVLWERKAGEGFSNPVVADGKLVLFHRVGEEEVVECLKVQTGEELWKFAYPTKFKDGIRMDSGPRATPSIADGKVYTHGAEGMLHCLDLNNGKVIWSVNTRERFKPERKWHGVITSPLIEGNCVMLNVGSTNGACMVGFDKTDGNVLWQSGNDKFTGSSPVCATIQNHRYAFFVTRSHLVGLNPTDGKVYCEYPWESRDKGAVIAATPVVVDDLVFISSIYGMGGTLLRVKNNQFEKVWASEDSLSTHYVTAVCQDGFLYGFHGHQAEHPSLRCIDLKTGKIQWKNDEVDGADIVLANGKLLLLTLHGELILAPASPKEFKIKAHAQILPYLVRAYPALSDGLLFGRSKEKLVCVDLRAKK